MHQISPFVQAFSFAGALLILLGYAGAQFGFMDAHRPAYNFINAAGSFILGVIALRPFQLGFVVLEFTWAAISLWALFRGVRSKHVT
ncbi:MAG: CBU_0592 family membrane protein [Candidatus Angelobacter sp.]